MRFPIPSYPFDHTTSHNNKICYHFTRRYRNALHEPNMLPPQMNQVFKNYFLLTVTQHNQQHLNLQYKAYRILLKTVSASSFFSTSANFYLAISLYNQLTNHSYKPRQHSLSLNFSHFLPAYFYIQTFGKSFFVPKPFNHFGLRLGSLVRALIVLISSYFFEIWTGIRGFIVTDSLSFNFRKVVYCRQQCLMKMLIIRMANYPLHPLQHTQPISITFKPYSEADLGLL